ncbi:MAG: hypothetical protein GTO22_21930 [Gemmatimonadales bacterium]|nr:hypothetical protein [Gemmatimonadales bacterium]
MKRHNRYTCLVATLAWLTACGGTEGRWTGTVSDSAGVQIVANSDAGMWTSRTRWTVEEELRIGAVEGDPNYQFGQIGFMAVSSDGRMFVLDAQAQQVKAFGADGEFQHTVGQPGGGPGEIGPGALFVFAGPGDTLLVPDMANQRVNLYVPDGASAGSFRFSFEDGIPMLFQTTSAGVLAVQRRPFPAPNQPVRDSLDAVVVLTTGGTVTDTLMTFPSGKTFQMSGGTPEINLYTQESIWRLTEGLKLIYGLNDDYRFGLYDSDGTCERIVTKSFEREPVSERDRDAVMSFLERVWTDAGVPPAVLPQLRSVVHFGEYFPAFSAIQLGPGGTIWVQHVQSAAALSDEELEQYNLLEDTGAPEWDVFDAEGRFLGVVSMPKRFAPRVFRDDKIYGVWRDELDVQYVMRLRVVMPSGGEATE